jgi:DNA-binding transcriptional ArsR family regulator
VSKLAQTGASTTHEHGPAASIGRLFSPQPGNPARRFPAARIRRSRRLTSGEIGESLGVRQNTMSTNLGILLKAGLVPRA